MLVIAAMVLAGCSAGASRTAPQTTVAVGGGSAATLRMPGGATVTVPADAVSGKGRLVGSVLTSPPSPGTGLSVGHAYDFHLTGAKLTGQVTLTLPAPPAAAVDGDPGPDTALLAYYDQTTRQWTPVPSTYDPVHHTVTAQSPHLSWWWPFRLDFGPIKTGLTNALKTVVGVNDHAEEPTCPGADQLKADGFVVGSDHADAPVLKSCAGVSGGHAQVSIANNRGYAMSVEYPDQWTATTTSADDVDQAIAAWVSQKISVASRGRKVAIVPAGQTITLTAVGSQNPIVTVTADGQAYLLTALLYGIDTLGMVLGKIPGTKMPSPSALATAVKTLITSSQCIREGIDIARTDAGTISGVKDVFTRGYKLAIGCLQDEWEVAYGVTAGIAAFVLGAIDWLITGVEDVIQGLVATVDSIHYFSGINFSVQGPSSAASPWTAPSLTFTDTSLGAVTLGMSQAAASQAAGMTLDAVGDGVMTADNPPPGLAYLYFTGGCIGAGENPGRTQKISAHGISLGDSGSKVPQVYGFAAQYMPAPDFGRTPASGYVVPAGSQRLAFVLSGGPSSTIVGIRLGPSDLTPSDCGG